MKKLSLLLLANCVPKITAAAVALKECVDSILILDRQIHPGQQVIVRVMAVRCSHMNKNIIARVVKQLHQLAQLPEILMRQYQICMPLFFIPQN